MNILNIARNGVLKTHIMYKANLSFELLRKYLDSLTKSGLLKAREREEKSFVTTENGRRFLDDFYELRRHSEIVESKRRALERDLRRSEMDCSSTRWVG